eukprot:COSAG05_NODE_14931_length_383_cov_0.683099_2_plen_82_part_01
MCSPSIIRWHSLANSSNVTRPSPFSSVSFHSRFSWSWTAARFDGGLRFAALLASKAEAIEVQKAVHFSNGMLRPEKMPKWAR